MKKILLCLILLPIFGFISNQFVFAQNRKARPKKAVVAKSAQIISASVSPALSPELQRRVDTFNVVWWTLKLNYFDQTFNGLDWNQVKAELEPRVLKTTTDAQLYDILQDMIFRLNRSHLAIVPPEVYQAIEKAKAEAKAKAQIESPTVAKHNQNAAEGEDDDPTDFGDDELKKFGIGADLRLMNDKFVVTGIDKDSAAETSGLKPGYIIDKINGVSLTEILQRVETAYSKIRNLRRYIPGEIVNWFLNGDKDSYVTLSCLDENDQPKEIKIQRKQLPGEEISIGKNFPEQFLRFETKDLNADTGYIKFNVFAVPVIGKFCTALSGFKDKKAIIVDLRGNSGGLLGSMVGLGGMLTDNSIDLGTSIYKVGSENMIAASKVKNYKGELIFLVDNQTISAAEVFTAALQENNRALVVGEKTAGEALPAVSLKLPTGAVFVYPIANYKTHNGNYLEGHGVEPNIIAKLDRQSLLQGKDNQLEAALKLIKEGNSFPKPPAAIPNSTFTISTAPPPPVPKALPSSKKIAEVTVKIPVPKPPVEKPNRIDAQAIDVIDSFIGKIGGAAALNKISSYTIRGVSRLALRGTSADLETWIFRQKPDKYAEVLKSASIGEVKEVYAGKKYFLQTDYGLERDYPIDVDTQKVEIFSPIYSLIKKDSYNSLIYSGVFDLKGKKTHVIEAKTTNGAEIAFAFDVETKMLISYTTDNFVIGFNDYRLVENLTLPFKIERGSANILEVQEIKLNPVIDEKSFEKKENCFDKAN